LKGESLLYICAVPSPEPGGGGKRIGDSEDL
jgi:hypothetical protein